MNPEIRPATAAEVPAIREVTEAAYRLYRDRLPVAPAPVTADQAAEVAAGRVWVTGEPVRGVLVLAHRPGHLLLESVAVDPGHTGQGLGRALIAFAEEHARQLGLPEIRLYTHALMHENQQLYPRLGYELTERRTEGAYDRFHYRKTL